MRSTFIFACKWDNPESGLCLRSAVSGRAYCKWHLMAHRLESLWRFGGSKDGAWREALIGWVPVLMFVVATAYFHFGTYHLTMFRSGMFPDQSVEYNPEFFLLFFGLSALLVGLIVSYYREDQLPGWINRAFHLWIGLLFVAAAVLYRISFTSDLGRLGNLPNGLFILGLAAVMHRIDRRTGKAAAALVLVGLGLIFVAGLSTPVMEILHQITGGFEYLRPVPPERRGGFAIRVYSAGLTVAFAAADAAAALYFTGKLLTPFRPDGRFAVALISVFGQGNILRHMLLPFFGQYVFDFDPVPLPCLPPPFYLAVVLWLHYAAWRRAQG